MTGDSALPDTFGRKLRNLRLSVTDRCNLRCAYCMPERDYVWLPRAEILTFEELDRLADVFVGLGVTKARLTGGEPLLRRDLPELVRLLAAKPRLSDLAITTNGVLLSDAARPLKQAGLHRVTVSLDTLRPERFEALTRFDNLDRVLAGIEAAADAGFAALKLDTVVMKGVNDDEILPLLEYGRKVGAEVRFIEYMDVGGATRWSPEAVFSRAEILATLTQRMGPVTPIASDGSAPAERFRLPDGTVFGIIASTTVPFCSSCDRSRLTADGLWYLCLYATKGIDLRGPLRAGASPEELAALIAEGWRRRDDRGAEQRLALRNRSPLVNIETLREDPHLEMHTRGG
jgi:GTP 3',8-cyclase